MATNDPFAKERANLSAGMGDEAGNLSSALGLNPPIIKPRLPTGPKPFPTPDQIGNYPGGSVAPMSAPAAAPEQTPGSDAALSSVTSAMGSQNVGAMRTAQGQAMQQAGELTGLAAMKKSENEILDATRIAESAKKDADEMKTLLSQSDAKTGENKAFVPTPESVKDIGMLFSLVSVAAFSSGGEGRYSGMAAMKNMGAAMQGYRQGRNDIFNKELKEYDKNMAALKSNNDLAQKALDNGVKLISINKDAGMAEIKRLAAIDNNGIVAMLARAGRFDDARKILGLTADAVEKSEEKRAALQERADRYAETIRRNKEMEALARDRLNNRQTKYGTLYIDPTDGTPYQQNLETGNYEVAVGLPKGIQKVGAPGKTGVGAAQLTAMNVMKQDVGNAGYNLDELKFSSQKTGRLPGGSVAFANVFKGDLTSDIIRYATTQTVDAGLQGNDALMLNLAFDIASAQSGGRGQLSDAKVRAVVSQMPLDDQPEDTKKKKWAAMFQRFHEANKVLPQEFRYPEEKVKELQDYFQPVRSTAKSFKTAEEAKAASDAGTLNDGDQIIVGGKSGKWRKE